jgi:transcriptional antiterminator NusG
MRKEWYVLQVYSGMENKVKENIEEKVKNLGYDKYIGKIVIPEIEELNYTNRRIDRMFVSKDAELFVKKGKDVKKGDLLAKEPAIKIKSKGKIVEAKNYRKIMVETEGKKYSKTFLIPESVGVIAGLRVGKKVVSGTPLSKNFEYECDVDGEIVGIEKVKRVVVQSDSGENEVYIVPKETFKSDSYKVGTIVEPEEIIGDAKEYRAKFAGRVDIRETALIIEIRLIKTKKKNLFPGYVFIEMIYTKEVEDTIKKIPYVSTFLNIGGKPVKLQKNEISAVLRLIGEESFEKKKLQEIRTDFEIGEHIKIISGPFEYFTGKIKGIDLEKQEVKVGVSMFGRETTVTLSLSEIEKIID